MSSSKTEIQVPLTPGALGVGIYRSAEGFCVVNAKTNKDSPLEVGDVIVRLNGVHLPSVEGGVKGWVALFQMHSQGERTAIVKRNKLAPPSGVAAATATATTTQGSLRAASATTSNITTTSAPTAAVQNSAAMVIQNNVAATKVTQRPAKSTTSARKTNSNATRSVTAVAYKMTTDTRLGVGLFGNVGCVKVSTIAKDSLFLDTELEVGMTIGTINGVAPSDAAHAVSLLKAAEGNVSIVATGSGTRKKTTKASKAKTSVGKKNKKEALKPSTYQNAQKRKAATSTAKASSKKQAVSKTKAAAKASVNNNKRKSKHEFNHDDEYMHLMEHGFPDPGCVSACQNYYVTKNDDTYITIAKMLGIEDWKQLAKMPFNERFYGKTSRNRKVLFATRTIIKIPKLAASKWKMNKMVDNYHEEIQAMATCSKCLRREITNDPDPMLMCDGCDIEMHLSCAGLTAVPTCDWLCPNCLKVMDARKKFLEQGAETRSLKAKLPDLPELDGDTLELAFRAHQRFSGGIASRKQRALDELEENQRVLGVALAKRIQKQRNDVRDAEFKKAAKTIAYNDACREVKNRLKLVGWNIHGFGTSYIQYRNNAGDTIELRKTTRWANHNWRTVYEKGTQLQWQTWRGKIERYSEEVDELPQYRAKNAAAKKLDSLKQELNSLEVEERMMPSVNEDDRRSLLLNFATLAREPRLNFETKKDYASRVGEDALFLGVLKTRDSSDVQTLNVLKEPTELLIIMPVISSNDDADAMDIEIGVEYFLWGSAELFCSDRNDCLPMDFSPTSVRSAQRDLITMLLRDPRNSSLLVSAPSVPSSVCLRGSGTDETLSQMTKCFDLSELVRDCNYPIENQPLLETPKRLADNGLELRNYQKTSLKWLVDKETNPSGMGSSGELWYRMRGFGGNENQGFFFCDLTGSILRCIFDYQSDVDQKDASELCGDSFPSSAILGSEMGLGKTVIALSLIVASPPSLQNRTLPREHIAQINHPSYVSPPSVSECLGIHGKGLLSSGTLVIAPMTLCPQWQAEIERFAPWMSFVTLHNDEKTATNEIASKDIVVISTFLLSSSGRGKSNSNGPSQLMNKLRKIHFHRIILDESHYNNTGDKVKKALSQLSATHRYAVTGTPVGHSLADLYGQLRFLRCPQFCRPDFWKQCIDSPYSNHNCYALNVLRSLLSRMVIRHSKEQNLGGEALVSLPPRTVETLYLEFGSDEEKTVYSYLEGINTARFMSLRSESPTTVLGKFIELNGMLFASRHACGHVSLVNLDNVHHMNDKIYQEQQRKKFGKGKKKEVEPKKQNQNLTRADILQQAIAKARPSASNRMRESILSIQEGEIEYLECPICLEPIEEKEIALTPCAHRFCGECIKACLKTLSSTREPRGNCPECRDLITLGELTFLGDAKDICQKVTTNDDDQKPRAEEKMETIDMNGFNLLTKDVFSSAPGAADKRISAVGLNSAEKRQQRACCHTIPGEVLEAWNIASVQIGSKVARLLEEIKCMIEKDSTSKCVVFSQFLGTLDIVQQELTVRGVNCTRVDGHMKQYERADNIHSFTNEPDVKVLLLSMRAGAAGLNLMAANYCFLLDPATNSAIEEQAIDRIHRIGQTRPVQVKRFIMRDSVEQRVLQNRRSRPPNSGLLDGSGDLEEEEKMTNLSQSRERLDDENGMGEKSFQRLKQLESLFGCSAIVKVTKA